MGNVSKRKLFQKRAENLTMSQITDSSDPVNIIQMSCKYHKQYDVLLPRYQVKFHAISNLRDRI